MQAKVALGRLLTPICSGQQKAATGTHTKLGNTYDFVGFASTLRDGNMAGRRTALTRCLMKKTALALALVVASLSLAGCFVGKGKAPAPIVTKG